MLFGGCFGGSSAGVRALIFCHEVVYGLGIEGVCFIISDLEQYSFGGLGDCGQGRVPHMASEPASSASGQHQRRPQAWLVWCFEHCRKVENGTHGLARADRAFFFFAGGGG